MARYHCESVLQKGIKAEDSSLFALESSCLFKEIFDISVSVFINTKTKKAKENQKCLKNVFLEYSAEYWDFSKAMLQMLRARVKRENTDASNKDTIEALLRLFISFPNIEIGNLQKVLVTRREEK